MSEDVHPRLLLAAEAVRHEDADLWRKFVDLHPELAQLVPPPEDRVAKSGRPRRRPTTEMTMIDGSPLRTPRSDELDVDGDPLVSSVVAPVGGVQLLLQGGHGFRIESVADEDKPVQTTCKYCGVVMTTATGSARGWLCELGDVVPGSLDWQSCECNWCMCRRQYEAGEYRNVGRPRIQCGAADCQRKAAADRKRASRSRKSRLFAIDEEDDLACGMSPSLAETGV